MRYRNLLIFGVTAATSFGAILVFVRGTLKKRLIVGTVAVAVLGAAALFGRGPIKDALMQIPAMRPLLGKKTVADQIETYGDIARARLRAMFREKGFAYPPEKLAMLAFKDKQVLDVYVGSADGVFKHLHTYPILGASGKLGPKLREGDFQVPEGVYRLESLEPNTPYHLALRLNYPNEFDLEHARIDGRSKPGSDILIHGSNGSVGCLAMGDVASEDLFVVANDTKDHNIAIIICPVDLRNFEPPPATPNDPVWLPTLYKEISQALKDFPAP
ncbi:MAG: hypothetical protein DKT66_07435 [Candidatus Melainabacteria bacterium]|nr:MAG: hypothetical protein DKT66_07435 [Candidatus Melainabacteria bacterium]